MDPPAPEGEASQEEEEEDADAVDEAALSEPPVPDAAGWMQVLRQPGP